MKSFSRTRKKCKIDKKYFFQKCKITDTVYLLNLQCDVWCYRWTGWQCWRGRPFRQNRPQPGEDSFSEEVHDMRGKEEKLLVFSPQCNLRPPPHRPWYSQPFWVWKVWTMTASWKMHSVLVQGLTCMSQPVHKSWNLPTFHFNLGALSLWPSDNTLLKPKPTAESPR